MISNDSLALVFSSRPIKMSPRFVLGGGGGGGEGGNVPCVAEVVNRSLKADCTDYINIESSFALKEKNAYQFH